MKGEVVPESKRDRAPGDEVRSSRSHWIVPLAQGLLVVVMALAGAELAARVTDSCGSARRCSRAPINGLI